MGLLAEGMCGSRPPVVWEFRHGEIVSWVAEVDPDDWWTRTYHTGRRALVLAWDGQPVVEGMDRVLRCLPKGGAWTGRDMLAAKLIAQEAVLQGIATLVLLDPTGAVLP